MFWQQIINGIMIGSVYALSSMGATLIYGILHILDIQNAGAYAIGAYFGWYIYSQTNNIFIAFIVSMAATGLLGVVIQKYIYYPIISKPNVIPIVPLITSVGLFTLTGDLIRLLMGPRVKNFGYEFNGETIDYMPYDIISIEPKPILKEIKGWKIDLTGITKKDQIPSELADYIVFLMSQLQGYIYIFSFFYIYRSVRSCFPFQTSPCIRSYIPLKKL